MVYSKCLNYNFLLSLTVFITTFEIDLTFIITPNKVIRKGFICMMNKEVQITMLCLNTYFIL